jgi:hypothetical protein
MPSIGQPHLGQQIRRYLWLQQHPNESSRAVNNVPLENLPHLRPDLKIDVYHSAVAKYYAPSDLGGMGGMVRQRIRSHPNWRRLYPRRNTVFCRTDDGRGLDTARVLLFFSFTLGDVKHMCALVHCYALARSSPDDDTGMWVVRPTFQGAQPSLRVIALQHILRASHLMPVYGGSFLPEDFDFSWSLDAFMSFFVNSYSDHHVHQLIK